MDIEISHDIQMGPATYLMGMQAMLTMLRGQINPAI
jgi:hypothetical protein